MTNKKMSAMAGLGIALAMVLSLGLPARISAEEEAIKALYRAPAGSEQTSYLSSRTMMPALLKSQATPTGLQRFVRLSKHDGNLIETGWVNQGQLADGYVDNSPGWSMIWPKGSGISYGFLFGFFVGAEVRDAKGNLIHIVSSRFHRSGIKQSADKSHWYDWKPLPRYFNNHHLNSTTYDIGGINEDVGIDGFPNTQDLGEGDGVLQQAEDFNRNGLLDHSMINVSEWGAMTNLRETWPTDWPPQSYEGDSRALTDTLGIGPCSGRWNGEFGYYARADQESYYVMDDREIDQFAYYPFNLPGTDTPDTRPWPNGRRGLGLTVQVRNYQWVARQAEDIMISRYDIINYGKAIAKSVIGMYSDVDVGGTLPMDDSDFDTIDDITYVWDKSGKSSQGLPTGYFGFAFLESPGISDNRKDDDEDGFVDESQWDLIDDDGDWRRWEDANGNGKWDTEDRNFNSVLDEGEDDNQNGKLDMETVWDDVGSDGIGPEDEGYAGPDPNGSEANGKPDQGEPNFGKTDNDEADQIGLTSWYLKDVDNRLAYDEEFWTVELQPGTFAIDEEYTRDVAFSYGSGFIRLEPGKEGRQKYAIACLCGNDLPDILRNKRTMQRIYDSDYNFSKPPRLPVLSTIVGDRKVVLMWDNNSEKSKDPIYGSDFEMYKIYRSTDPQFSDIKTVSDAFGNPLLYKPLAQFDLKDGLTGPHPIPIGGNGSGDGLDLGVAYDMGEDTGLRHSFVDTNLTNGRTYYYAVVSVDKGYAADFFSRGLSDRQNLTPNSPTECTAVIQTNILGQTVFVDRNCAVVVPMEAAAGYMPPQLESGVEHTAGIGTGSIHIEVLIPDSIKRNHEYQLSFRDDGSIEKFDKTFKTGLTNGAILVDVTSGDTLLRAKDKYKSDEFAEKLFHGFKMDIMNHDSIKTDWAGWVKGASNLIGDPRGYDSQCRAVPRDYEVRVLSMGADTSYSAVPGREIRTNYKVYDITDPDHPFEVVFGLSENGDSLKGVLSAGDQIAIKASPLVVTVGGVVKYIYTETSWRINFALPRGVDNIYQLLPKHGDVFRFLTRKPFDRHDVFTFKVIGAEVRQELVKSAMENIYTVPDPYIAASTLEKRLVSQDVGRGDRRIDFVNLPAECKISIFTSAGRLVREIEHHGLAEQGRESWDLRTKDGLEVSHGVYFYHVDAPNVGSKIGKLAIIK
ncbi:MAG TPA: hypothetical protein PK843_11475 [bacterium]|nr:hypothetical protein [bacterium]